ncbi:protein LAX PANICLE 2-like [Macadamia integrifolia]|uniref:protein LAX PANICLE 2-like n=1 Tax=Macadamia integrifolia TaxID=60698 RepID=UPI001C4F4D89|nr:protein LAX PANICLE 2-like [Macadamia integrifolia]
MAEDDSRTSSRNEAGSSSKGGCGGGGSGSGGVGGGSRDAFHQEQEEEPRDDEGSWLQLGIGSGGRPDPKLQDPLQLTGTRPPPGLFDLDLKPPGGGAAGGDGCGGGGSMTELRAPLSPTATRTPPPLLQPPFFFQHQHPTRAATTTSLTRLIFPHQREFAWGYNRPNPNLLPWTPSSVPSSPSSSSATPSSSMLPGPYYARIFQHYPGSSIDVAGPGPSSSSDDIVRVIDAPSRPHSGVWFLLQASQNQAKEPFLPQIPKSFLRIKDGRMTVLLLMKYLVNKLSLDSESEVEIRCRGQQLPPLLTLQHVRDNIWSSTSSSSTSPSRDVAAAVTLLPDSSTTTTTTTPTTDHFVMILHYGRTA